MSSETKDMHRNFLFCFVLYIHTYSDVIPSGRVSRIVTDNSGTVCDSFEMAKSAPVTARYQCVHGNPRHFVMADVMV
jgi:hypothetical protein